MPKKAKEVKEKKPSGKFRFPFLSSMDEEKKKKAVKVTGLAVAAFAVFTLIAIISYLFTWKADQSLLSDPFMMDGEMKTAMIRSLAIYMRQQYLIWNKDSVADETIFQDI